MARRQGKELVDANLFDVDGPIRVNFSRSSLNGEPLFSYKDAELDLSFRGDDISCAETSLGELIAVTLQDVPDGFTRIFTLLVPTIRVAPGEESQFDTLGIETIDRAGAFVPPPGPFGSLQTHLVHQLHGTARQVAF